VKEALKIVKDTNKSENDPGRELVEEFGPANSLQSVNEAPKELDNTEDKKSLDEKSGQANNVSKEADRMEVEKQNEKEKMI
jgi:hypothetical protein